jgi:hypothetical protein
MPMKSASYEKYYAKNRDALVAKMRERYDPEKKAEYYEQHKEQMKTAMAMRYAENKANRNFAVCNEILALNPPDHLRQKVNELIGEGEPYRTAHKRTLDFLKRQAEQHIQQNIAVGVVA